MPVKRGGRGASGPPVRRASAPALPDPMVLLALARDNRASELEALLAAGAPARYANKMGQTPLHVAALWGNLDAMRVLLAAGADVNAKNVQGSAPLHFAACAKSDARGAVELLLAAGADAQVQDDFGYVPYERAEAPDVRLLLGGPDQRLFDFAAAGDAAALRELLAGGSVRSLRVVDADGAHALNLAIRAGRDATADVLLAADPSLALLSDATGNTPLHWACATGNAALVERLLEAKPRLDAQNLNMCEYTNGSWVVADKPLTPLDKTPLHLAVEAGELGIVRLLLAAGASPKVLDFSGAAPLHVAIEAQDEEMLRALLSGGADADAPSKDVASPVLATAQRGPASLLEALLEAGAAAGRADDGGWTPLHLAARAGSAAKVALLLRHGASHAAANAQGNTPLHLAAINGHAEVVQALLREGADAAAANSSGRRPGDVAKTDVVRHVLLAAGGA